MKRVTIRVPATTANLGPGFDAFGCALSLYTDVTFEEGAFRVTLLGRTFAISHPDCVFTALDGGSLPPLPTRTFLLRYLLEGKQAALSLGYKTFREMPWGELYIMPYTGRCLKRAAFTFGSQVAAFAAACERMGGEKLPHGDAGYGFAFLGGYRMQIMIYAGDEEFPPSSQILYSDNFASGFSAEDRVVASDILISVIRQEMKRN